MRTTVFYSWQSDLPNATNRGFIGTALEQAVKKITQDPPVEFEPVIDRDTAGVPGSPGIAQKIFAKIDTAAVFLADVSIVVRDQESPRPTPNPNVLIETGYALKALGESRTILVINEHFGSVSELPFDLRSRRVLRYTEPDSKTDRSSSRKELAKKLEDAIRLILKDLPTEANSISEATNSIKSRTADRVAKVRLGHRHTEGSALGVIVPFCLFVEADLNLLLRAIATGNGQVSWKAPIAKNLAELPLFLRLVESRQTAEAFADAVGAPSIQALKRLFCKLRDYLGSLPDDVYEEVIPKESVEKIGTR